LATGSVLIGVGAAEEALILGTSDNCQVSSVVDGCLRRMFNEGIVGTVLVTTGLVILVGTLLTEPHEVPEPRSQSLDDRYATQARLAAGAGHCNAALAIVDRLEGARRAELETDPAIIACR